MEVPEKIYFSQIENGTHYYTEAIPFERDYIEYVRKDAFVQKACQWLKSNITNNPNANSVLARNGCVTLGMLIEDFKKYMEDQEQNPTWSEEDEIEFNHILKTLTSVEKEQEIKGYNNLIGSINWLKSLKDRIK